MRQIALADQVILLEGGKLSQVGDSGKLDCCEDKFPELFSHQPEHCPEVKTSAAPKVTGGSVGAVAQPTQQKPVTPGKKTTAHETRVVGTRGKSTYRFYLRPVGALQVGVLLAAVILMAFSTRFQRIWVGWWAEAAPSLDAMYIGVYYLLAVGACINFMFFFW